MLEKVLSLLADDMDDMEGKSAMVHSSEECPDPLTCGQHDDEMSKSLTPDGGEPVKMGMPSLDGVKEGDDDSKAEEGLSPEEADELRKLLK